MLKFKYKMKQLDFIALNSRRENGGGETVCALERTGRRLVKFSPLFSFFSP